MYFLKEVYGRNLNEITNVRTSDSLSAADKLLMNQNKVDEGVVTISDMNIKLTTKRIEKIIDIEIPEEEIDYYVENFTPSKLQETLVHSYLTKYFGNYRDLNLLPRRDYIHLLLLVKKKLLIDFGYAHRNDDKIYYTILPYILTGNMSERVNNRVLRNARLDTKIENSYLYQDLINNKYKKLEMIKPGYLKDIIKNILNTRYTYCTYEYPEALGEEITYDENKGADEILYFLHQI